MKTCTIHEAKTNLSRLIMDVEAGGEVIISRGKVPVARLVAVKPSPKKRELGMFKGEFSIGPEFFEPLPEEELAAWE